ncbi:DUF1284 domain-containing protein [Halothermothrix orenii]|uniref:Uncharacterized conserved protein n=1 Tax=Halothermothrix orenii (strain H 168 / OCM 544 / DSM 9562) TaxID=373903 RepID=B8D246_HALOH|nr:DUF1284 domain-containing protein [Halothermothrix orenii]ACL69273.1 uncharacterized conserved protein [Halothermothrix orenii H 168]
MVQLRGHHLLCVQFFQGLGYSKEFIQKMYELLKKIEEPSTRILLTTSCDYLCQACPWHNEYTCTISSPSEELKLVERDKAVLSYFGFEEHQLITAGLYKKRVDLLLPKLDLKKICGNCRWFEICNSKRGQVD